MSKKSFKPNPGRSSKFFKPIPLSSNLLVPFYWAIPLAACVAAIFSFTFHKYSPLLYGSIFTFEFVIFYPLALAITTERMYGAKHRFLCALLISEISKGSKFIEPLYSLIEYIYPRLGKHVFEEEIAAYCDARNEYQEYTEQGKYGLMLQNTDAIDKFFQEGTSYHTKRRYFITFTGDSQDYIRR
ncbi:protein of unknown function [Pseudodesulfovibrio profundus]|uniref:Uncharacterized protein n=1 Tax=Pseudodesulfovibrio profundus TaxID=57320 RepID=A0A2C8F618_9BACT|nr:hypothetical protein [Pseudodesulfovibrio profundus]SOB57562.1 protein of unknown function [Pseudodesulfovibrio profundus]